MEELLKKILESEMLNEETREEFKKAFETLVEETKASVREETREEVEAEVRLALAEQWAEEREQLIEAMGELINDVTARELDELKEDISRFRDLELEYAERLAEEKERLREGVQEDLRRLVEHLDEFIEMKLVNELEELKEDIEETRKIHFGKKIFESFAEEFMRSGFFKEQDVARELEETRKALNEAQKTIETLSESYEQILRESKIEQLTKNLKGRSRTVMRTLLESASIPVNELESAYEMFLADVLERSSGQEKETSSVLTEGVEETREETTDLLAEGAIVGDEVKEPKEIPSIVKQLAHLAGVSTRK